MPFITIIAGALLIFLGMYGYFGSEVDSRSMTAFIPAFIGLPILLCGVSSLKKNVRKHMIHIALVIALLGALAGWGRGFSSMFSDKSNARALTMVFLMAIICTGYVVMGVRSFIAARKRRKQESV